MYGVCVYGVRVFVCVYVCVWCVCVFVCGLSVFFFDSSLPAMTGMPLLLYFFREAIRFFKVCFCFFFFLLKRFLSPRCALSQVPRSCAEHKAFNPHQLCKPEHRLLDSLASASPPKLCDSVEQCQEKCCVHQTEFDPISCQQLFQDTPTSCNATGIRKKLSYGSHSCWRMECREQCCEPVPGCNVGRIRIRMLYPLFAFFCVCSVALPFLRCPQRVCASESSRGLFALKL